MIRVSRAADNNINNDKGRGASNNFFENWKLRFALDNLHRLSIEKETHFLFPSMYNFLMALVFHLALELFIHVLSFLLYCKQLGDQTSLCLNFIASKAPSLLCPEKSRYLQSYLWVT